MVLGLALVHVVKLVSLIKSGVHNTLTAIVGNAIVCYVNNWNGFLPLISGIFVMILKIPESMEVSYDRTGTEKILPFATKYNL